MKIFSTITLAVLIIFFTIYASLASEAKATKEECMAKTKEAAKMIREKGVEAALEEINDKGGPFVWKNTYVFCFNEDTVKMIGHPYVPKRIRDLSQKDYMDANGKLVFQEFIKIVKDKGEGWVDYMHVRKAGDRPHKKMSFVMKVPDTKVIVGAGIYE